MDEKPCPLTPALFDVLRACIRLRDTRDETLADELCRSRMTINSEFKRMFHMTGARTRGGLLVMALQLEWLPLHPSPPP